MSRRIRFSAYRRTSFGSGPGISLRFGRHYWHLRRNPLDVISERMRWRCNWWQAGDWRLTHRWNVKEPRS